MSEQHNHVPRPSTPRHRQSLHSGRPTTPIRKDSLGLPDFIRHTQSTRERLDRLEEATKSIEDIVKRLWELAEKEEDERASELGSYTSE